MADARCAAGHLTYEELPPYVASCAVSAQRIADLRLQTIEEHLHASVVVIEQGLEDTVGTLTRSAIEHAGWGAWLCRGNPEQRAIRFLVEHLEAIRNSALSTGNSDEARGMLDSARSKWQEAVDHGWLVSKRYITKWPRGAAEVQGVSRPSATQAVGELFAPLSEAHGRRFYASASWHLHRMPPGLLREGQRFMQRVAVPIGIALMAYDLAVAEYLTLHEDPRQAELWGQLKVVRFHVDDLVLELLPRPGGGIWLDEWDWGEDDEWDEDE